MHCVFVSAGQLQTNVAFSVLNITPVYLPDMIRHIKIIYFTKVYFTLYDSENKFELATDKF